MKNLFRNIAIGLGLVAVGGAVAYKFGMFDSGLEAEGEAVYPGDQDNAQVTGDAIPETEPTLTE